MTGVLLGLLAVSVLLSGCNLRIAGAGSDTTFDVLDDITPLYNNDSSSGSDTAYNIPPVLTGSQTFTVPGENGKVACPGTTYSTSNPPPNGSSAGVTALVNDTQGCIDFARSSRDRRSTDPSNLEFYAFARDAVTWSRWSNACPGGDAGPAGCSPITLTQAQLKGIYICDQPGNLPKFTNWNQVGGDNEPIRRYLPQVGSGTGSFFETRILGLTTAQQGVVDDSACAASSKPIRVQENAGNAVASTQRPRAILPYSFAQWTAQSNGVVTDIRAGALLARINNIVPNATTIGNATFLGVRYVYNVTKTSSPSYARAVNFVGVRPASSGGNGYLCSNNATVQNLISDHGFIPLPFQSAGSGLPNSRCKKNPAPL